MGGCPKASIHVRLKFAFEAFEPRTTKRPTTEALERREAPRP